MIKSFLAALIGGIVLFGVARISQDFWKRALSPLTMFLGVWYINVVAFLLRLVPYPPLSLETVGFITMCWFCFTTGFLMCPLVRCVAGRHRRLDFNMPSEAALSSDEAHCFHLLKKIILGILYLTSVAVLFLYLKVFSILGLSAYRYPWVVRELFLTHQIELPRLLSYSIGGIYVNSVLTGYLLGRFSRGYALAITNILVVIFYSFVGLGRGSFLQSLILFGSSLFLSQNRRKQRSLLLILMLIIIFVIYSAFIGSFTQKATEQTLLYHLYMYFTGNLAAFNDYLSNSSAHEPHIGISVYPWARMLYRIGAIPEIGPEFYEFVDVPYPFNNYTYLRAFHEDYGVVGSIILHYMMGVFIAIAYSNYSKRANRGIYLLSDVVILSFIFLFLMFSWCNAITSSSYFWISLICSLLVSKAVTLFNCKNYRKTVEVKKLRLADLPKQK